MPNIASTPSIEDTIGSAEEAIRIEQRRVTAEIEAYQQFARKLGKISTTAPPQPTLVTQYDTVERSVNSDTSLIQELFEETVMSVSHYEEDYNESSLFSIGRNITQLGRSLPEKEILTRSWRRISSHSAPKSRRVTMYRDERSKIGCEYPAGEQIMG